MSEGGRDINYHCPSCERLAGELALAKSEIERLAPDADLGKLVRGMQTGDTLDFWAKDGWHYMKFTGAWENNEYIGTTPEEALSMTRKAK